MMKPKIIFSFLISLIFIAMVGCSTRSDKPVVLSNLTITYPSKKADGISANLTLCRKIDKKSGKRIGVGTGFTIMEKTRVYVLADILNWNQNEDRELMFHFNWIGPDGKSLYKKRIDILPNDSSSTIRSAISISSETREAGEYTIQLYFFRELIAEKKFELFPEFDVVSFFKENQPQIALFKKPYRKTGNNNVEDTVFFIGKNNKVNALFDIGNRFDYGHRELIFRFEWFGDDTTAFYKKQISIPSDDSSSIIKSAISIAPEKRKQGDYVLQLFLFDKLIAKKQFKLVPKPVIPPIKAHISLCKRIDKKTGKRLGEGTEFNLGNKRKVHASVTLYNRGENNKKELKILLEWIGPNGKIFYRKKINLAPNDPNSTIKSSISISPEKREAGKYALRVTLFNKLIAEKRFELIQ